MNPHIFYWKWCEEEFDEDVMRERTMDIIENTEFDLIYIALHGMKNTNILHLTDENLSVLKECNKIFNDHGRKVFFDVSRFADLKVNDDEMKGVQKFVGKLDENGEFVAEVESDGEVITDGGRLTSGAEDFTEVLNCWVVDMIDNKVFKNKTDVAFTAEVSDGKVRISTGKENAGRDIIYYLAFTHRNYDLLGDGYAEIFDMLFEKVKDIPFAGAAVDEMGITMCKEKNRWVWVDGKVGESIDMLDVDKCDCRCYRFVYSRNMEMQYQYNYGEGLLDNLIYFWNREEGNEGKSVRVVNQYFDNLRRAFTKNEEVLYNYTKKYFGPDAFVGAHPTLMGDKLDNNTEKLHNGISWWDVKRDYAQTDELVIIPIRMAMTRKCPKNIWYNMWYSMRTMDIRTYYTETYTNVIYAGRTHHLGYKCYEPGVVLCVDTPEMMHGLRDMERKVDVLDDLQLARPDARVLVLFSYSASINHHISDPEVDYTGRRARLNHDILKTTNELFEYPYLCDLVPSTEIDQGFVKYDNGKVSYCGHEYDAVVVIHPDGVSNTTYEWLKNVDKEGANIIVCGQDVEYFFNGVKLADEDRYHFTNYMPEVSAEEIAKKLLSWGVKQNKGENFCVFEDGSVTITNRGNKSVGNGVKCDAYDIDEPNADIVFIDKDGNKHII